MALTPFVGTVTAAQLRANFDDKTTTLQTNMRAGQKDHAKILRLASLLAGSDVSLRSVAWTQQDDQEVRVLNVRATDTGAGRVVTGTLTVDNADTVFLVDNAISVSITTVVGTADSRPGTLDLRTTSGTRIRLVKGVRYRLTLSVDAGTCTGPILLELQRRTIRRRA